MSAPRAPTAPLRAPAHEIAQAEFVLSGSDMGGSAARPDLLALEIRRHVLPRIEAACDVAGIDIDLWVPEIDIDLGRLTAPLDWAALADRIFDEIVHHIAEAAGRGADTGPHARRPGGARDGAGASAITPVDKDRETAASPTGPAVGVHDTPATPSDTAKRNQAGTAALPAPAEGRPPAEGPDIDGPTGGLPAHPGDAATPSDHGATDTSEARTGGGTTQDVFTPGPDLPVVDGAGSDSRDSGSGKHRDTAREALSTPTASRRDAAPDQGPGDPGRGPMAPSDGDAAQVDRTPEAVVATQLRHALGLAPDARPARTELAEMPAARLRDAFALVLNGMPGSGPFVAAVDARARSGAAPGAFLAAVLDDLLSDRPADLEQAAEWAGASDPDTVGGPGPVGSGVASERTAAADGVPAPGPAMTLSGDAAPGDPPRPDRPDTPPDRGTDSPRDPPGADVAIPGQQDGARSPGGAPPAPLHTLSETRGSRPRPDAAAADRGAAPASDGVRSGNAGDADTGQSGRDTDASAARDATDQARGSVAEPRGTPRAHPSPAARAGDASGLQTDRDGRARAAAPSPAVAAVSRGSGRTVMTDATETADASAAPASEPRGTDEAGTPEGGEAGPDVSGAAPSEPPRDRAHTPSDAAARSGAGPYGPPTAAAGGAPAQRDGDAGPVPSAGSQDAADAVGTGGGAAERPSGGGRSDGAMDEHPDLTGMDRPSDPTGNGAASDAKRTVFGTSAPRRTLPDADSEPSAGGAGGTDPRPERIADPARAAADPGAAALADLMSGRDPGLAALTALVANLAILRRAISDPHRGNHMRDLLARADGGRLARVAVSALAPAAAARDIAALHALWTALSVVAPDRAGGSTGMWRFALARRSGAVPAAGGIPGLVLRALETLAPAAPDRAEIAEALLAQWQTGRASIPAALRVQLIDGARLAMQGTPAADRRDTQATAGQSRLTETAGLVLIAPFVTRLFRKCDVLDADGMLPEQARPRAASLLAAICYGSAPPEGPPGPLEHLMLGVRGAQGLPLIDPLTREDLALVDGLLQAVITQWGALGGTRPEGLREAFLRREGVIEDTGNLSVSLRVAPRAYDMLLDRLPWPMTPVKLRWMDGPIHVSWRRSGGDD